MTNSQFLVFRTFFEIQCYMYAVPSIYCSSRTKEELAGGKEEHCTYCQPSPGPLAPGWRSRRSSWRPGPRCASSPRTLGRRSAARYLIKSDYIILLVTLFATLYCRYYPAKTKVGRKWYQLTGVAYCWGAG